MKQLATTFYVTNYTSDKEPCIIFRNKIVQGERKPSVTIYFSWINVRKSDREDQEWTIQRHREHRTHDENKQEKTQPTQKTNNKQPRSSQKSGVNPGAHEGLVVPAS